MALFKSSNPALNEKKFQSTVLDGVIPADGMTVKGTIQKFGFLFLMVLGTSIHSWRVHSYGGDVMPLMWGGIIGGLVIALVIAFKKEWAPFLAPLYALAQGLFIGSISSIFDFAFAETAPNIIMNAVGLTLGVSVGMYFLYTFRIIKVTEKLRSVIIAATVGIMIFYLLVWVMRMFGMESMPFLHEGSTMGIIFSLVVVTIAALNLLLDFDMIEKGAAMGAPKYMEWFGAFGLLVTIVWLYIEILRLLSKVYSRD
jgi:uncharacterized YccA/Bax inhibitor family protein